MTVPFALVIIKPMSVGRGDAPDILSAILNKCPVSLRMFRAWTICRTTLEALCGDGKGPTFPPGRPSPSWICLFTHLDRVTDPTEILTDYFGGPEKERWLLHHLKYQFSGYRKIGKAAHLADDVVYLSPIERCEFEACVLFTDFDKKAI
jgi:hypothetical protein